MRSSYDKTQELFIERELMLLLFFGSFFIRWLGKQVVGKIVGPQRQIFFSRMVRTRFSGEHDDESSRRFISLDKEKNRSSLKHEEVSHASPRFYCFLSFTISPLTHTDSNPALFQVFVVCLSLVLVSLLSLSLSLVLSV